MNIDDDPIMLFKLVTGELIIGTLDKDLTEETKDDVIYVKQPAVIGLTQNSFYLTKYNQFSKLNIIMIMGKNVVYVDMADDNILAYYHDLINPKVTKSRIDDDEGTRQLVH